MIYGPSVRSAVAACDVLRRLSQLAKQTPASLLALLAVRHDVLQEHSAMGLGVLASAVMCQLSPVQQLDQVRTRDMKQVRCLLRSQFEVMRRNCHGLALGHGCSDETKRSEGRSRDLDLVAIRSYESTNAARAKQSVDARKQLAGALGLARTWSQQRVDRAVNALVGRPPRTTRLALDFRFHDDSLPACPSAV